PPEAALQFGAIKGYYVGYKRKESNDKYVYKTLENRENFREERILTNLERNTKYKIRVQAFNSKGAGPPSDDVEVETLQEGVRDFLFFLSFGIRVARSELQNRAKLT
ncbi:hypothetical protein AVEN_209821-1, partial [Araneus ventricosus]